MTDRETVLAAYPKAYAWHWADCWIIYSGARVNMHLGKGRIRKEAWQDAAAEIGKEKP